MMDNLDNVMQKFDMKEAKNTDELLACYPVLKEFRPQYDTPQKFLDQVTKQMEEGYRLFYMMEAGKVIAITGFRINEFFARGKTMYIDDVATLSSERDKGHGDKMLDFDLACAKQMNCDQVHFDIFFERYDELRFFLNKGFTLTCHHGSLNLK